MIVKDTENVIDDQIYVAKMIKRKNLEIEKEYSINNCSKRLKKKQIN